MKHSYSLKSCGDLRENFAAFADVSQRFQAILFFQFDANVMALQLFGDDAGLPEPSPQEAQLQRGLGKPVRQRQRAIIRAAQLLLSKRRPLAVGLLYHRKFQSVTSFRRPRLFRYNACGGQRLWD